MRKRDDFDEQLARQAQKAGARLYERCNVGAPDRSTSAPAGSSACTPSSATEKTPRSPSTPRWWSPPTATPPGSRSRWACTAARTGRWASPSARTSPRPRHDDDYLESWLELWDRRGGAGPAAARLRLDLRHGRRHLQRRPRHPQHLRRLQGAGLARDPQGVVRLHAGGLGLHPGEHDRPDPRRRAADGLQPPAALHPRPAAGRRRGRPGQPVQRRGHRLRDGVRADRRRRHRPGARPGHPGTARTGARSATRRSSRTPTAATTRWAAPS